MYGELVPYPYIVGYIVEVAAEADVGKVGEAAMDDAGVEEVKDNDDDVNAGDVGASTGGFTDCMLQNGAVKVYSVDVGHGQLAWKLVQDDRVICMDRTNIRYVTPDQIDDVLDFASIDVSFISLTKVLLPVKNLLKENGQIVCLIKPQFEAGRENVGKKGVVRDKKVHVQVIEKVIEYAMSIGFKILNLDYSPVKGPEGNIEYLLYLQNNGEEPVVDEICVDPVKVVEDSHVTLDKKKQENS